jgi:hypothetical protein
MIDTPAHYFTKAAAVFLAAPAVSVCNSIVKFADLLIPIFMKIATFSAPISTSLCEFYLCQAGF